MRLRSLFLRTRWRIKESLAPKYTGGGMKQIRRIPNHELVYRIFDYVHGRALYDNSALDWDLRSVSSHEQAFWYAWDVDCEVTNGGFNQYFFNKLTRPTGVILSSYRVLGAKEHEAVFSAALEAQKFVTGAHVDVLRRAGGKINDVLQGFSSTYIDNPLNELDKEYYKIRPEIRDILVDFAKKNIQHFTRSKN